ncbi:MAG TPA: MATE family efflux transporter [Bryobacteraceae bacterium]|nr:MATE family efflux transporter [Bryobacteraceae bacterium]
MRDRLEILRQEFRPTLRLAAPLVLAELGWMTMTLVDTAMVGRLGPRAIGAVGLGSMLFYTLGIFGTGMMLGLDTLVSQAFGAGKLEDCHRWLLNAVYVCLPAAPLLMGAMWLALPALGRFGINPAVLAEAVPFLKALLWSAPPLLLYFAVRRYLQGMSLVKPVMFALVSANAVNLAGDWVLIFGKLGAPALGAAGSGWSTCAARVYMLGALAAYLLYRDRRQDLGLRRVPLAPDPARIRRLLGLGVPAGLMFSLEVGVFALVTALAGRLDAASLAAHYVALNVVSCTYMVPLGISSAAAVRVGQALGRGDARAAAHAGWVAVLCGATFMSAAAVVLVAIPGPIVRIFSSDAQVIRTGSILLAVAAVFQLFDGIQTVATGALRGAGDTRTPMLCHLLSYWLLGLPLGYFLCFRRHWGAAGLWAGLCAALVVIGTVLLAAWARQVRRASAVFPAAR